MFAITGITGNAGGNIARNLLAAGRPVRAVMRDVRKGDGWAQRGCELATADILDVAALASAFEGAEGVFVLVPPNFDPAPSFPEARATAATLKSAIRKTTSGQSRVPVDDRRASGQTEPAHTAHNHRASAGRAVDAHCLPATGMVYGKFQMGCCCSARDGVIPSFLQPLDKPVPMVATADVGRVAAEVLQGIWNGRRVVELEGPRRLSPDEVAATFAELLGRPVRMDAVPRETWEPLFRSQGMKNPTPRIRMLDGFNEGWIEFENSEASSRKGEVALKTVLQMLIEQERK